MSESGDGNKNQRGLLIAVRILYVLIVLIVLRRVYSIFIFQVRYFSSGSWAMAVSAVFTLLFIVILAIQFAQVFLKKEGKIIGEKLMLGVIIAFILYDVYSKIRLFIVVTELAKTQLPTITTFVIPLIQSVIIWAVLLGYGVMINRISKGQPKAR